MTSFTQNPLESPLSDNVPSFAPTSQMKDIDLDALDNKERQYTPHIMGGVVLMFLLSFGYFLSGISIENPYYIALFWIVSVSVALWWGNLIIISVLDKSLPWEKHTKGRFFLQILVSIIYSLLCINFTYYQYKLQFTGYIPDIGQLLTLNVYGLLFLFPVLTIQIGIYLMRKWKQAFVQTEELKNAQLRSQFEVLKTQIDPHFLFNNLNILSSLIDEENKDAQDFLESFSEVYRFVLKSRNTELVPLEEELDFADHYILMLQKRFDWNIHFDIQIDTSVEAYMLPPMALQMLLENVVKHNTINKEKALYIDIFNDSHNFLVVRNNLREKEYKRRSSGMGLNNINKRYQYLSNQAIEVKKTADSFIVRLPLLEKE
ncbi:sensor histidine kinase [Algivirga pacifica]|uniref:Histidine kinase n=1 Tax=Algivirga pacifica TaxID=1162670 RepID=A0ABP9DNM5_9BACT